MPIDGGGSADSDGHATPAPPVSCDFGPFGEQTQVNLETLGTQKLCKIPLLRFPRSPLLRPIPSLSYLWLTLSSLLYSQPSFCRKAAPMCSTLARQFGDLTGVLSIQTTDRVRKCSFTLGPH
jgi:hypothetical protein